MSDLEARYRTVLYWYPSTWREENADVVLGTLMDEADAAGRSRPQPAELASLAFNGLLARVGHVASISRGTRDRLAAFAFGTGFAIMAIMFVGSEWAPFGSTYRASFSGFGPFLSGAVVINGLWIMSFAIAIVGLRRWSHFVLLIAIAASVAAILLINAYPWLYARPPASALVLMIVLAVVAMGGRPTRRWLLGSAAVSAVMFIAFCVVQYSANGWRFEGWLGSGWMVTANGWWGIALFVLAGLFIATRQARWVAPVALFGTLWTLYSVGTNFIAHQDFTVVFFAAIGLVLVLFVIAVASMVLRGYRFQLVKVARE